MLKLKTDIVVPAAPFRITYNDTIVSLGSCFAQNMATRLEQQLYTTCVNPFGVLYNPFSIRNSLALLINNYEFGTQDIFEHKGIWNSFQHHSSFSGLDPKVVLNHINYELNEARQHLQNAKVLVLTFGTAWVYELKKTNKVVSNCHRVPASKFRRRRLTVTEIVEDLRKLLQYLQEKLPHLKIILTVSPIRHLKDGMIENQISKSTLLLAVHQLVAELNHTYYFPAYEVMQDDLRDYRFYDADLVHPSPVALDYIWQLFETHCLEPKEQKLRQTATKLQRAATHRAFQPESEEHQLFIQKQLRALQRLTTKIPASPIFKVLQQHFEQQVK